MNGNLPRGLRIIYFAKNITSFFKKLYFIILVDLYASLSRFFFGTRIQINVSQGSIILLAPPPLRGEKRNQVREENSRKKRKKEKKREKEKGEKKREKRERKRGKEK